MTKKELWLRLKAYHFEHLVPVGIWDAVSAKFAGKNACTQAFAHKISTQYGWKLNFAQRALEEYKKFVYLGVVSDFAVTPSEVIDKVWHKHLLFSKAYRIFCNEVIEHTFDHTPELIKIEEQIEIYQWQYFETLALYKSEFNTEPPADVWGIPKFDNKVVVPDLFLSKKKSENTLSDNTQSYSSEGSLYSSFTTHECNNLSEFGGFGGGDSGGGGAEGSWDVGDNNDVSTDSDSGASCSSCSSGCGGD